MRQRYTCHLHHLHHRSPQVAQDAPGSRRGREEMRRILEEIIRDDDTNATARCTAIRTLLEIVPPEVSSQFDDLHAVRLRRSGDRSR
jgi:hypothetical protein